MVLTSNLPLTQWASTFADDQTITAANARSSAAPCSLAQVAGENYPLENKRKAGQVKSRTTEKA